MLTSATRRLGPRAGAWALPGLLALLVLGPAAAQPAAEDARAQARQAFETGVMYMQIEGWEEAVVELERSLGLHPTRAALYNLGLCHQSLSRPADAIQAFQRFLRDYGASAPENERAEVEGLIRGLQPQVGRLVVRVSVPDAAVAVDGDAVGRSPLADDLMLEPGEHLVEVALDGYAPVRRELRLAAGESVVLDLMLEVLGRSDGGTTAGVGAVAPDGTTTAPGDDGLSPALFWTMLGVGGAAGIAAGVVGGLTLAGAADYADDPYRTAEQRDEGRLWALGTDICIGVAAAAGLTALLVAFWTDWGDDEAPADDGNDGGATAVSPFALDGGAGLLMVGRF